MLDVALLSVGIALVLLAAWYSCFLHFNRRRGSLVLRWLEQAVVEHGELTDAAWAGPATLRAGLSLSNSDLHQASVEVQLAPRQMPPSWVWWCWRDRQETLTFKANLGSPPTEGLEISRRRWTGPARWRRGRSLSGGTGKQTQPVATFYLSTQPTWKPQVIERMGSALSITEFQCMAVSFQRGKPHFQVTLSLEEALRQRGAESAIFESVRELAAGSPRSRM